MMHHKRDYENTPNIKAFYLHQLNEIVCYSIKKICFFRFMVLIVVKSSCHNSYNKLKMGRG